MIRVPNSSGTTRPRLPVPRDACDCHLHIYDPRFAMPHPGRRATADATVADYRLLQHRLGTTRAVVVQPAAYGTDNRVTVDAIEGIGRERARGIAVATPDITDAALAALHAAGIRGLRFSLHEPRAAATDAGMIEPLARRVAGLGWHVQVHLQAPQIVELAPILDRLPTPVVFDHLGRLHPGGLRDPAFGVVAGLLERGHAWVKLSGAYLNSALGGPAYAECTEVAQAYVRLAPDRCVWGSDWPHPTEALAKPDDAALLDLLLDWAPAAAVRQRLLVDNPAALYGF